MAQQDPREGKRLSTRLQCLNSIFITLGILLSFLFYNNYSKKPELVAIAIIASYLDVLRPNMDSLQPQQGCLMYLFL